MSALQAISDNLSMLAHTAATFDRGNDLALIERIRRDLGYLRGYEDVAAFVEATETTSAVSATDAEVTPGVGGEENKGPSAGTSKFDKV